MMQEIFRCIVCLAEFKSAADLAKHRCPHPQEAKKAA